MTTNRFILGSMGNHIAIFMPSLRGGGVERVMLLLAQAFAVRGLEVDLVLASAEGPYLKDVDESVRIVDLKRRRILTSLPALAKYLKVRQPLAMISAMAHANVVAVWAKLISGAPTSVLVTEHVNLSRAQLEASNVRQHLVPWFMRLSYGHADRIVAVSGGVADDLATAINIPRERIEVVYNPVESHQLATLCNAELSHPSLPDDSIPFILATGRLHPQKDFSTLIRAFAHLRKDRRARLVILGEGGQRGDLEALIESLGLTGEILLPGFVDNPYAWMRRASLFVLSSAYEGFGIVLVEAMACGTPVVSTDCPSGPAEILENGRWGALVPVADVAALANAMSSSLDSDDHPDVAKRAGYFNLDMAVNRYLDLLQINV